MSKPCLFHGLYVAVLIGGWALSAPADADDRLQFDARLTDYSYPFDVHTFEFDTQRQTLDMAYMHLPAEGDMPTVVLLHGKNFASAYWEDTARYLHEQGYGVLMPDQIGFGKSSKPAHYQFTVEGLVNNTHRLVESLNLEQIMVIGHSMGGMLATRYALMHEDRVKKLVMVNPVGLEDYLRYVKYQDVDFFYQNELDKTIEQVREYQQAHYYDGEWSERYEALTKIHEGWINGSDWERVAWNNALTFEMIFTGSVVNEFERIAVPTHLIIGTRDTTAPGRGWKKEGVEHELGQFEQLGQRAAATIPDAQLHQLDDIGHMPQFEAPERYLAILDSIF